MDDLNFTLSKIVATSKDNFWAQAYTAGKLYIVLSLEGEADTSVASLGKETLEKLQREFFALDEKTLEDIKKAVETVAASIPEGLNSSILLGTFVKNVLYIIIKGNGTAFLKRGDSLSVIGKGEENALSGFSGHVESNDVVALVTNGFLQTVSHTALTDALAANSPSDSAETLAPLVHDKAIGTEAALIMKVVIPDSAPEEEAVAEVEKEEIPTAPEESVKNSFKLPNVSSVFGQIPHTIPNFKKLGKKQLLIIGVVILVIILLGSILREKMKRDSSRNEVIVTEILTPNKQKYEDAMGIMSLNKTLAVEELTDAKTAVLKGKEKLPAGSNGAKELDAFLAQIDSALNGKVPSGNSQISVFFDASKNSDIPTVSYITSKGGTIAVIGSKKGGLLKSDGSVDSSFNGADSLSGITEDDKNVYVLTGNTVEQIDKGSGKATTIISKQASPISIDTFGGNIYLLSSTDKTINKYRPTGFTKESYFASDTTIPSPSSMAIDSSIYVITDGAIKKYTRGTEDSFSYKGPKLSSGSQIYTDADYVNLYVLDPSAKTATVMDKTGNAISSTSLKGMKNITGIAADEKAKKMYVVADNKIYQIAF